MTVFDFQNYKEFVNSYLLKQVNGGRGLFKLYAKQMSISAVVLSQVFRGARDLTSEQAIELSELLGLTKLEKEFFLLQVEFERAGSSKLRIHIKQKMNEIKASSTDLKNRILAKKTLDPFDKAFFYSNWYQMAIWLMTSVSSSKTSESIALKLNLPIAVVNEVIEFLLSTGLIKKENDLLFMGEELIHIEKNSPFIKNHHKNWRAKAIEGMDRINDDEIFYSCPLTISKKDAVLIRKFISELIDESLKVVGKSSPESLFCLNIDWFQVSQNPKKIT